MRVVLLIVTVAFLCGLAALVGFDIAHQGVTVPAVLGILIMPLIGVPIIGALTSRHSEDVEAELARAREHRRIWDEANRI